MAGVDEQHITGIQSIREFESGPFLYRRLNEFTRTSMDLNPRRGIDTDELRRQLTISYGAAGQASRIPTPNLNHLRWSKMTHDPIKNVGIEHIEPPIVKDKFPGSYIR